MNHELRIIFKFRVKNLPLRRKKGIFASKMAHCNETIVTTNY